MLYSVSSITIFSRPPMTLSKAILELYSACCINVRFLLNDLEQVILGTVSLYYYVNLSSAVSLPGAF